MSVDLRAWPGNLDLARRNISVANVAVSDTVSGLLGVFSGLVVNGVLSGVVISYSGIEAEIISGLQASLGSGVQTVTYSGRLANITSGIINDGVISGRQANFSSGLTANVISGDRAYFSSGISVGSGEAVRISLSGIEGLAGRDLTVYHSGVRVAFFDGTESRVVGTGTSSQVSFGTNDTIWRFMRRQYMPADDNFTDLGEAVNRIRDIYMLGNISGANRIQASGLVINDIISGARAVFTSGIQARTATPTTSTLGSGFWTVAFTSAAGTPRVFINFSGVIFNVGLVSGDGA